MSVASVVMMLMMIVSVALVASMIVLVVEAVRIEIDINKRRNRRITKKERMQRLVDAARISGGIVE